MILSEYRQVLGIFKPVSTEGNGARFDFPRTIHGLVARAANPIL